MYSMSTYCYKNDDGEVIEKQFPSGQASSKIVINDKIYERDYQSELTGSCVFVKGTENPVRYPASRQGWPMVCNASGVQPNQAQELRDHLAKCGVPTEVTKEGDPIYISASHRKKALKVRGMIDKSSYY